MPYSIAPHHNGPKEQSKSSQLPSLQTILRNTYILWQAAKCRVGEPPGPVNIVLRPISKNHFRSLQLLPGNNGSFRQQFPVYRDTVMKASIEVNGQSFQQNFDFISPPTLYTSTFLFSEALYLPESAIDSISAASINGKLVIVSGNKAANLAVKSRAAAILQINNTNELPKTDNRYIPRDKGFQRQYEPNNFIISQTLANSILENNDRTKTSTIKKNIKLEFIKQTDQILSSNVIACVEGSDKKDEYLFVTAHYDHLGQTANSVIYHGADDDGSGTVTILELAEAFAKAKSSRSWPEAHYCIYDSFRRGKGFMGVTLL